MTYATEHGQAVLSLDNDFITLHNKWMDEGKTHAGIFRGKRQLQGNIGVVVKAVMEYHDLIASGAGTMEDLKNQIFHIK